MELRELLNIVWERRLVVSVTLVCCIAAAAAYAFSRTEHNYESSATIAFLPDPKQSQSTPSENLSNLLSTYAVVAQSSKNLEAASALLGHPLTGTVSTATASGSWILGISSKDTTPKGAAATARAVTEALVKTIQRNGVLVPTIINPAVASDEPIQPKSPSLIIGLAAILGLIAGVLLSLFLENLDDVSGTSDNPPLTSTGQSG